MLYIYVYYKIFLIPILVFSGDISNPYGDGKNNNKAPKEDSRYDPRYGGARHIQPLPDPGVHPMGGMAIHPGMLICNIINVDSCKCVLCNDQPITFTFTIFTLIIYFLHLYL